jgi:hypothetical protein
LKQAKFEQFLGTKEVICLAQASRTADRDMKTATIQLRNAEFQRIREENKKLKRAVVGLTSGIIHIGRYDMAGEMTMIRTVLQFLTTTFKHSMIHMLVPTIAFRIEQRLYDAAYPQGERRREDIHIDPTAVLWQNSAAEDTIASHYIGL